MDTQSLYSILYTFLDWHPARIATFGDLIWGVVKAKTVKIKELAIHVSSKGNLHAKIVRIERLLLEQEINFTVIGKIIVKLMQPLGKLMIAIDRTNWKFGSSNLNFFVAAVVYGSITIPIAWLLLDKKGNSSTAERKKLIEQIVEIVSKDRIEIILADREFVGKKWLEYLNTDQIPFAIRVKKNEQMKHPNGGKMKFSKYFSGMQKGDMKTANTKLYGILIKVTCLQLEKELLLVVSNVAIGEAALIAYKQRWSIERTFKSLKTSGFNIEDTHMTDQEKLRKLFAITSLSLAICVIAGEIKNNIRPIKIKKHGRKLYSLFTYGFDWLKEYFYNLKNQSLAALFALLQCKIIRVIQ